MKFDSTGLLLSATDLSQFLGCRHATELDRALAEGGAERPTGFDPNLALLQERGLAHERAYLDHLRSRGLEVVELAAEEGPDRLLAALRRGADAIVQPVLGSGRWRGRADLLFKVDEPSALGGWSYEVVETKLAQVTRGGTVLQLCLYTDLLAALLGREPERMHVVRPGVDFVPESYRFADFRAYYRLVRGRLERTVSELPSGTTYPYPVAHCDVCRWWRDCDDRRHRDDHLCLVAGLRRLHLDELERQGFTTLEDWAESADALRERPDRGHVETFERGHGQARIQLTGRRAGAPRHELLPIEDKKGLAALPPPSPGDLFFDLEGDPFVPGGELQFLFGVFSEDSGAETYRSFWALDEADERRAFEGFVDLIMERWERFPDLHLYHFSPYEPAALKRLMSRHGTREIEVDRLLRGERFVDLLAVTRQALRASVERYSLKDLEPFIQFVRSVDLPEAAAALRRVAWTLGFDARREISDADRATVTGYNRDDCRSARALRDWLEELRAGVEAGGHPIERPEPKTGEASDAVEERDADVQEVFAALVAGLPEDRASWSDEERARWLLAHLLGYLRREDRVAWWEFFRLHELDFDELLEERKTIAGLEFLSVTEGGTARNPLHRYRFPPQEVGLDEGDALHEVGGEYVGTISTIDRAAGLLEIKKASAALEVHPAAVLVNDRVTPQPIDEAILALGRFVVAEGADGPGPFRAVRDLLLGRAPRVAHPAPGPLRREGEAVLDAALRLARELDHGVLAIQGPPGSGKTYNGARMIVVLVRAGYRVGVTAVSHKVIRNLLEETLEAAHKDGFALEAVAKVSDSGPEPPPGLTELRKVDVHAILAEGKVVGGTAWLWAREELVEALDFLFVDEAGQLSLAHTLAAGRSAKNLVLLGDPQQLEQPQRGAHPEGAEVAALVHLLAGKPTIPDDRGLFLDLTWRLSPALCRFTSELFYEGRLHSRPGLERQVLGGPTRFTGSGLYFLPVEHEGNTNRSDEEVAAVERIFTDLLAPGVTWTDADGVVHPLQLDEILIVAPYNAQVQALQERLPRGARVGTVDKFQGQEAPVVVYSLASSSAADAPRGLSFLFNPNRLNVATSRARCVSILVAAPRLLEPDCRTPDEMRWANGLCRYRELAEEIRLDGR